MFFNRNITQYTLEDPKESKGRGLQEQTEE